MNDLLEQFLVECRELAETATEDLLALETSPGDRGRVDGAFRGFHTLKGAAGIVDFVAMGELLHAAESVLALVRSGERQVSGELIGDCLACLDQVVRWLDEIEAIGELPASPEAAPAALLDRLTVRPPDPDPPGTGASDRADEHAGHFERHDAARDGRVKPGHDVSLGAGAGEVKAGEDVSLDAGTGGVKTGGDVSRGAGAGGTRSGRDMSPDAVAVLEEQLLLAANNDAAGFAGRLGSAARVAANVLRHSGRRDASRTISEAGARGQLEGTGGPFIAALRAVLGQPNGEVEPHAPGEGPPDRHEDPVPRTRTTRSLRVDVERIDALVNLAGELTVAKNAVGHSALLARDRADPDGLARTLKDQHALLERLVAELRSSVLGIRVLPLRNVFRHFPRLVREMARDLGKSVRLVIEGQATEADKAIVEALFEPLLHVLRNALDHGVELENERRAAGKSPGATLYLRAMREGGQVIVEVTDDGRGIDSSEIRRAAVRHGIIPEARLAEMSDHAVHELIFSPGFSTATAVTGVSGRGVGMDAVRSAITRMGGRVTLASQPGAGTSVRFILPFTVMMSRVMTVEAGGQVFGIPIEMIAETVRIPRARISRLGHAEAIVLRERTVPLIRLTDILDLPRAGSPVGSSGASSDGSFGGSPMDADARIVVVAAGDQSNDTGIKPVGALEVEGFGERMEIMLKPMEGLLDGVPGFAGTTFLGDGRVLIVLDLHELLRRECER